MVVFEHVDKAYDLQAGRRTLAGTLQLLTGVSSSNDPFYALRDVSFQIGRGEAFGVIGRNGAGKSTLLKIIAGITKPTRGHVTVSGRVSSLIELGAGFHPDLTGRENVYLSGAILGIRKKLIDAKFREIVDFAELWDFIDVPVKKYSSGMYARLGFSVAVSVDPEILIIDEILSVGDVFFQQKCFGKMREIIRGGTTFIYVTHDTAGMQNLCDRALLLEGGRVEFVGGTTEAVSRYFAGQSARPPAPSGSLRPAARAQASGWSPSREELCTHSILRRGGPRHGERGLEILALRVTDPAAGDTLTTSIEGTLIFDVLIRARDPVSRPRVGINLYDRMGNLIFAAGNAQLGYELPHLDRGEEVIVSLRLDLAVSPGEYTFSVNASEPSEGGGPNAGYFHDVHEALGPLVVAADGDRVYPFYGLAKLPLRIAHSSVPAR